MFFFLSTPLYWTDALVGISFSPQNLGLRFDFTFGPEAGDVAIELYQIVHFVFSQPFNVNNQDYCFWVGEVELRKLEKDASQVLSRFDYPFNSQKITDFNSDSLFHFHLEGDVGMEVVCGNYKLFHEFNLDR